MMMLQVGMGDSGPKAVLPAILAAAAMYPANAPISLASSGGWTTNGSSGTWLIRGTGADFEVRASGRTGSLPSGTFDTWLPLSSTRTWTLTSSSGVDKTCSFTLEIRRASDGVVVASCAALIDTSALT